MTTREFFTAVAALTNVDSALVEFASESIRKMDEANEKRRNSVSKAAEANAPIVDELVTMLSETPKTASDLLAEMGGADRLTPAGKPFSVQYVSNLARTAVKLNQAVQTDVKIKGKGSQKAYIKA